MSIFLLYLFLHKIREQEGRSYLEKFLLVEGGRRWGNDEGK
jgi:hypothetical protein